ncbi:SnoaL-like domain-containing protein [Pseudomaricurvus alkylphenolicus]|jgi:ketosteroid isomerase-like protein|uniref:nuclear transport factor 2 family protein n=1 Tax=Pseudomaricurvus alkylphenolicus TaxID=1306991 RepID=UPI0014246F6B|nr:nuclear transport factor 2 family protein [Pseudomaricurvus alkylphenolicus]NIB38993.1 SnoaL-like domain-containing protein [Pseudomaricurvus alkylphenolicus]
MKNPLALKQINDARGTLSREQIERKVRDFQASYANKDWQTRAALLSNDVVFEDTVGVPPPAIGREAAAEYFQSVIAYGINVNMTAEKIIVMGNESFVLTRAIWWKDGDEPERLLLIQNFKFNDDGEMCHIRIAYDEGCLE